MARGKGPGPAGQVQIASEGPANEAGDPPKAGMGPVVEHQSLLERLRVINISLYGFSTRVSTAPSLSVSKPLPRDSYSATPFRVIVVVFLIPNLA